jgi:outer membrane protein
MGSSPIAAAARAGKAALCLVPAMVPLVVPGAAWADDLRNALETAYHTNPTLVGARSNQRATDEQVPIAEASGRPSVSSSAQYVEYPVIDVNNYGAPTRSFDASANLSVPIYQGGAVRNSIRAARTRVTAGQADLRGTESSVFSQVVAAYLDVVQNEAIVGLNRNNVQVLEVNLQATRDRFEIGDLTRTDVAQSESRLALARGDTRTSEAQLAAARETYIRLVGKPPTNLAPPPPLPNLPASAEDAVAFALDNNPDISAARQRSKAAGYDVKSAGAGRLPQLSLFAGGGYDNYFGTLGAGVPGVYTQTDTSAQVGVRATLPLYQGGLPAAQRRQAQDRESSTLEDEIAIERSVIAQTRSAFTAWVASREIITSSQTAVDAANLSLEGVRAENSVGNRTILDILNAEQELLSAQVRLVQARRNEYVAGFTLLAAMGRAQARDLGIGGNDGAGLYDATVNAHRAARSWLDWDDRPSPRAQATRTVDTPVQDGNIPPSKQEETTEGQRNAPSR